jgi:hypothetical protein
MDKARLFKLCFCLLLLLPFSLQAQKKQYSEEVTVVAPYQPKISDADKINTQPGILDTVISKPSFTYGIISKPFPTTYKPEPIEAAKMAGEPIKKLYENLIKIGFGSYKTPYGEYIFNSTRSKSLAYGVHLKHISSTGDIDNYAYPGYSNNSIKVFARQFREKTYNLSAAGGFKREVIHYYGFHPKDYIASPSDNDLRQRYNKIFLNTAIQSAKGDSSRLAYDARLGGYHFFDKFKSSETNIYLAGGVEKTQQLFKISDKQRWGIKSKLDYYNNKTKETSAQNGVLFELRPFLFAQRGALGIKAGFNLTTESDSSTFLHFYPEIELRARVIPQWLNLFFGLTGYTERNSFLKFTDDNPFVITNLPLSFKNVKYKFYGGFNSNIANTLDLYFIIAKSQVKNQYFYVNSESDSLNNSFSVIYDDNCDVFELKADIAWHYSQHFSLTYSFHLNQYSTSQILPWQVSDFDMNLQAAYNIQNKVMIDLAIIYFDRMYARTYGPNNTIESKYLRDRFDANLGIEYSFSRMISAFVRLNNLASVRYYYWNNYPVQKFNILGGLSFSF